MLTLKTEKEYSANRRVPTARNIYAPVSQAFDAMEQGECEKEFFASLRLRNGTYKLTYARRFDDLNALVNPLMPPARPLKVMDVAVSSGVSTLEWMESLERAGIEYHMTAGDITTKGFLISINEDLHVLVDDAGYPLQFDINGTPVPNPPRRRFGTIYFLQLRSIRKTLAKHFKDLRAACAGEGAPVKRDGIECRRVALVSPRLKPSPRLEVIDDDILSNTKLARRFHVLRAANILNHSYFDEETLNAILRNLRSRLLPGGGGLLIVCRTNEQDVNNATVFTLNEAGRFEATARLGEGSEVESLVLNLRPDDSGSGRGGEM